MVKNNPEVNKRAIEIHADSTLNEEQKTAQLHDFIRILNDQALAYVSSVAMGKQKKRRKPTEA